MQSVRITVRYSVTSVTLCNAPDGYSQRGLCGHSFRWSFTMLVDWIGASYSLEKVVVEHKEMCYLFPFSGEMQRLSTIVILEFFFSRLKSRVPFSRFINFFFAPVPPVPCHHCLPRSNMSRKSNAILHQLRCVDNNGCDRGGNVPGNR